MIKGRRNDNMQQNEDRTYWLHMMQRIADPVLTALSAERLKIEMPIEAKADDRAKYSHLEAFGRLACGLAPWIEHGPREGEEGELREKYANQMRKSIENATNPSSPDYMNFSDGQQPIVDAAFLAHAIVRAPRQLYDELSPTAKHNLSHALKMTRDRKPHFNNWLLFSAMIETALFVMGETWDRMRIDYALKQHEQWYLGDGIYGDGPYFHNDYYNSFVIQPMLVDLIKRLKNQSSDWEKLAPIIEKRASRYATIQERIISPEGAFPAVGRSIVYRLGVFQHLAQMTYQHHLDPALQPAQVRCALTAVMKRMMEMPGTSDENGWLQIGFCGHQPELGESYISTGSLYLCATVFLPLGLPEKDSFWQGSADWTMKKIWSGQTTIIDQSLE